MWFDKKVIELFKKNVRNHGYIDLPSEGDSMYPLIRKGNICRFVYCEPLKLIKGDIVLYYSETGQLIAHRFCLTKIVDNQRQYIFKGDTNLGYDQPVTDDQIIGKLAFIKKAKRKVWVTEFSVVLWGKIIHSQPLISGVLRRYLNWKMLSI